jgi:hypothetical protein
LFVFKLKGLFPKTVHNTVQNGVIAASK